MGCSNSTDIKAKPSVPKQIEGSNSQYENPVEKRTPEYHPAESKMNFDSEKKTQQV